MEPLANNNKVPLFKSSFPLFNYDLLTSANFELDFSNLLPLDEISKIIQAKLHQKADLDGDFDLFSTKGKKKCMKPLKRKNVSNTKVKLARDYDQSEVLTEKKSNLIDETRKAKKVKRTIKTKLASGQYMGQNLSPNKRAFSSLRNVVEEPRNFPSLASLLEEEEEEDMFDDDECTFEGLTRNTTEAEISEKPSPMFPIDLFGQKNYDQSMMTEQIENCDKTFAVCDMPLFTKIFSEPTQPQKRVEKNKKKVKPNPRGIDEIYKSYGIYGNLAVNNKMGSFGLLLKEETSINTFSGKIEVKLPIEENNNLSLNSQMDVVMSK
jgi:hypothetical protein